MNDPIVVDFEGFAEGAPILAGVLVGDEFVQVAFNDVEPAIAMAATAKDMRCVALADFCRDLVERARVEGRAICGFSCHERDCIAESSAAGWPADIEYIDAKRCAHAWREREHPGERERWQGLRKQMKKRKAWIPRGLGNRLVDFVRLRGTPIPSSYGYGRVTATFERVIAQSRCKASYADFPPGAKRAWTRLLSHNRLDCEWALAFIENEHVRRTPVLHFAHVRT